MVKTYALFIALLLCIFVQISLQTDPALPIEVSVLMGSRHMRYHHFLWHNLRELWHNLDQDTRTTISKLGWEPPRPSLDASYNVIEDNNSGEDFLYMHKQMVKKVNEIVAGTPYNKVVGWTRIPDLTNTEYAVPAPYTVEWDAGFTTVVADLKSDNFYLNTIKPEEDNMMDPAYLRGLDLGDFGAKLEYGIHKYAHLRFSTKKANIGLRNTGVANPTPDIDEIWDNLQYDWLGDAYSSHVNPWFWKIHGYVEDRIEAWRVANGLRTIVWKGTWQGGPMGQLENLFKAGLAHDARNGTAPSDCEDVKANMEKVIEILLEKGHSGSFSRHHRFSGSSHHH